MALFSQRFISEAVSEMRLKYNLFLDALNKWAGALSGIDIANVPAGTISATTVQAAINELDAEKTTLLNVYPVGAIYMSVVSTSPATLFGGTWAAFAAGKVLVGIDSGDTDFDTVEETRGAKTHTLQTTEIPSHTHAITYGATLVAGVNAFGLTNTNSGSTNIGSTGGGGAHNNIQPSIVVYMWKRTA